MINLKNKEKYTNYLNHVSTEYTHYYRNYNRDLPQEIDKKTKSSQKMSWVDLGKRVTLLVIPFLSLYKPFGMGISVSMGTIRCTTQLIMTFQKVLQEEYTLAGFHMGQAILSTITVAGSIFHFTLGMVLTTGQECLFSASESIHHLVSGKWDQAGEDFLQTAASISYLGILLTGGLEIACASLLLQATLSLYQSRKEFSQERYPEAIAKALFGIIRCYEAHTICGWIQQKYRLIAISQQFSELFERAEKAKKAWHLIEHPLNDLEANIEEHRVILSDASDKEYDFGSHFHGFGKQLVKGANLSLRTKNVGETAVTELDFKVNHAFRDRLGALIQDLQRISPQDLQLLLKTSHSHASNITVKQTPFEISPTLKMATAYQIDMEGLGSILIGNSKLTPNLFDRVIVRMNPKHNIYQLHEMLCFLNLDDTLKSSTEEDMIRLKMGHLFRSFFPKEATTLERSSAFFVLPIEQLRQKIIKKAPEMHDVFNEHLHAMQARDILRGRVRYSIPGLAEKAHATGARALTAAVMGAYTDTELFHRTASMLKMGMLSSEMRFTNGIQASGMSSSGDFITGGADSVYTQMITEKDCQNQIPWNHFFYHSKIRLLISLSALETGTYQYHDDSFGTRIPTFPYSERPGILPFIEKGNADALNSDHEVMLKERISPTLFQAVIVPDRQTRDHLLQYLRECHLIQKDSSGAEKVLNKDVNHFIRVSKFASEELLT